MIKKESLKNIKLWWPMLQIGIPFDSYGYCLEASGHNYKFKVDPELDSWLCSDGSIMPISGAELCLYKNGIFEKLDWTSFTIDSVEGIHTQVNFRLPGSMEYSCKMLPTEDLFMVGEAYYEDE